MREELYKFKYKALCERLKPILEKKSFQVYIVENGQQAKELVERLIPEGATVSSGGSLTLSD
ncbi:MAG: LUD domain-containing protein, partial [Pseudothermotoga sp.]